MPLTVRQPTNYKSCCLEKVNASWTTFK